MMVGICIPFWSYHGLLLSPKRGTQAHVAFPPALAKLVQNNPCNGTFGAIPSYISLLSASPLPGTSVHVSVSAVFVFPSPIRKQPELSAY